MSEKTPLTIGIDARAAAEVPAGRGRVVRELLRALAAREDDNRYVLYARQEWTEQLDERFSWRLIGARDPLWHMLAARAANRECEVFLSSNSYLTTLFLRVPAVTIVYDLTTFERSMRPNRRSTAIERLTLGPATRRSRTLLAISQATADALAHRFPGAADRTVVAPLGVTPALDATLDPDEAGQLPSPGFVLAVGTLEPRKNLPRLVAAYSSLDEPLQREHPLVVVGALGWETGETLDALRSLGDRCTRLGYVSDATLAELYRRCAVFCYPSLGEGFGLPVLEAMAAGAAVITSDLSSLPEVGGDAVEYCDPRDARSIAAGLRHVLTDATRSDELRDRASSRAKMFTWERFSDTVVGALERAAGRMHDGAVSGEPLVSIGIPTYERASTLRRAVASALSQSYASVEVIICDDGSSDSTETLCRKFVAEDPRVRYLRSPQNLGLAANHNKLFEEMRGRYAMLLSDDDWLEPDYVERCLARLQADPGYVLISGIARYVKDGEGIRDGVSLRLDQASAAQRIRAYLRAVDENGLLYGLMPRDVLMRAAPMRNAFGNDWLLMMNVLAQGKALTIEQTAIQRELGGTSAGFAKLASTFDLPRWQARVPHLIIAWHVLVDICRRGGSYRALAPTERLALALTAPWAAIRWRSLVWHMFTPMFASLRHRRWGRHLWRWYLRLARAAGGATDIQ